MFRQLLQRLGNHLKELDRQVDELSGQIQLWRKVNELSLSLADIPGIGPLMASALVASIGDAKSFDNWTAIGGLAGIGASSALYGWQADVTGDQQTGPNAVDPRRSGESKISLLWRYNNTSLNKED